MSLGQWTLQLETFRNHTTEIVMKDEAGASLNLSGWFAKIEVAHDDGVIVWSTATGHFMIPTPTTQGKLILSVSKTEIAALPFDWANFSFFAGADAASADLIYQGKARRI
jgi:hypothetical protein